jgi:hypothetical protein
MERVSGLGLVEHLLQESVQVAGNNGAAFENKSSASTPSHRLEEGT